MKKLLVLAAVAAGFAGLQAGTALSSNNCSFTVKGSTMSLNADCTTDSTILVPDGVTLDGKGHTINAVDPAGDHFKGAVVQAGGTTANVQNLIIAGHFTQDVCDSGADRLRGILFDGASGTITHNTVTGITQPNSGCQEGNAIEVRNAPFDGTHPATKTVTIDHNSVSSWQKTGILANGDVSVSIDHNTVGASADQPNYIAGNSIQLGFGATGSIDHNDLTGNQWCGASDDAATAILLYESGPANVDHNKIGGNSDIGIYVGSNNIVVDHNDVSDDPSIADCNQQGYDIGIGNYGDDRPGGDPTTNTITHNTVSGFDTPFDGPVGDHNKVKPAH